MYEQRGTTMESHGDSSEGRRPRAAFMAFGTKGDVFPVAVREGWHLAELFHVQCVVTAPYVVPYSAPSSFERRFKQDLPLLYKYFQDAPANMDPVTNLPLWHMRTQSPVLLMGFLRNPRAFLMVLGAVIETTNYKIILFSSGYKPLDTAIQSIASASSTALKPCTSCGDSTILFNGRLFCFSGSVPYSWIFPQCAVAVHHAGSGTTAAALHAGIPQVVCPYLLDQFYWAEKLCWLEVAPEPLQRQHVTPDSDDSASIVEAAEALSRAIRLALTPEMKEQAAKIAERVSSEDGIGEALKVLKEKVASPFKRRKD
ncbi:Sterol 3-beta-glucosyltransferase UGT80B1 [Ananas comosus]|uniref:Sterol 3-beta-glucosyltransferase UGT80B1 n=1 Tax=Ananas comosus TaxID=4615 RepID=A0A199W8F5_ANACO|nr:Sterol 3-beta-glucosyltransferase UGT80B1 [Ananas comosus]